jgi:hypothetical protein
MRWHTADHLAQDRSDGYPRPRVLADRSFWLHVRRPLVTCALRGHKPVVDGTAGIGRLPGLRWVCCDRCGTRPQPQGRLDAELYEIGEPWPGEPRGGAGQAPGAVWPRHDGVIGGELIIGRCLNIGAAVKVGSAASDHMLAGHLTMGRIGGLYLHAERFGTWLQRRLNRGGCESRVTQVYLFERRLWWQVWQPSDSWTMGTPRWRNGNVMVNPADLLWGEKRYTYRDASEWTETMVAVSPGESYPVRMKLQREHHGRRGRRQAVRWVVACESPGAGIPHRDKPGREGLNGWAVPVPDEDVDAGLWREAAVAATMVKIAGLRAQYGYQTAEVRHC